MATIDLVVVADAKEAANLHVVRIHVDLLYGGFALAQRIAELVLAEHGTGVVPRCRRLSAAGARVGLGRQVLGQVVQAAFAARLAAQARRAQFAADATPLRLGRHWTQHGVVVVVTGEPRGSNAHQRDQY